MTRKARPAEAAPLRFQTRCVQCTMLVDTKSNGVGEIVQGVAVNRAQGGSNMITLKEPTGQWLCRECIDRRKHKHQTWTQGALFE